LYGMLLKNCACDCSTIARKKIRNAILFWLMWWRGAISFCFVDQIWVQQMRETSGQNGIGKNQVFPEKMGRIRNFTAPFRLKTEKKTGKKGYRYRFPRQILTRGFPLENTGR